ncbi:MAG TPA: branched-chain amino acid ABC transporter permease, partial [Paracoccaceae bacterium]|nr:branched-chain amino acid ABC transporter permease [Paracoccaceae bacterium]
MPTTPTARTAPPFAKLRAIGRAPLFWITVVVLGALVFLPAYFSSYTYILGLLTIAFYLAVWSMGWDLLFGFAGEVNFGPSFLVALGAYTAGMLNYHFGTPIWLCLVAASVVAVLGGFIMALPALRVTGPYFALTTLVAVLIMQNLVIVFAGATGGEIGLVVPDIITFDPVANYYIALGFMTVSGAILYGLARSPFGLILEAAGQDPVETAALGFNVAKHKLAAFCVSAFFTGLG